MRPHFFFQGTNIKAAKETPRFSFDDYILGKTEVLLPIPNRSERIGGIKETTGFIWRAKGSSKKFPFEQFRGILAHGYVADILPYDRAKREHPALLEDVEPFFRRMNDP